MSSTANSLKQFAAELLELSGQIKFVAEVKNLADRAGGDRSMETASAELNASLRGVRERMKEVEESLTPYKQRKVEDMAQWERENPLTLVGGNRPYHVMSVLLAEHSHGRGILGFLDLYDATSLRRVCKELRDEVTAFPWNDLGTTIEGSLRVFREIFPFACGVSLCGRAAEVKKCDIMAIRGIRHLDVSAHRPDDIEQGTKMPLKEDQLKLFLRVESLNVYGCADLSEMALAPLTGLRSLTMGSWYDTLSTNSYWSSHLGKLEMLKLIRADGLELDLPLANMKSLRTLDMDESSDTVISDAGFAHLQGLHTLNMRRCTQATITDAGFANLQGLHTLNMSWCTQTTITDEAFAFLQGLHALNMSYCRQATINPEVAFSHLKSIKTLDASHCNVTDDSLAHLKRVHTLDISGCSSVTDAGIAHLEGIHTLKINDCTHADLTGSSFRHLRSLVILEFSGCSAAVQAAANLALAESKHLRGEE